MFTLFINLIDRERGPEVGNVTNSFENMADPFTQKGNRDRIGCSWSPWTFSLYSRWRTPATSSYAHEPSSVMLSTSYDGVMNSSPFCQATHRVGTARTLMSCSKFYREWGSPMGNIHPRWLGPHLAVSNRKLPLSNYSGAWCSTFQNGNNNDKTKHKNII
jgi:hypothetical protein